VFSVTRRFLVAAPTIAILLLPGQVLPSMTPVQNWTKLSHKLLGTDHTENTVLLLRTLRGNGRCLESPLINGSIFHNIVPHIGLYLPTGVML
jgi:hypothetical protein